MNPSVSGNLGDVFAEHADSDSVAIVDLYNPTKPCEYTFREFNGNCDAVANGLIVAGLEPGDRIGILALNRVEFLEVLFGAMRAGCVPVMINVKLPAETAEYIISDAEVKIIFADADQIARLNDSTRIVSFGEGDDPFDRFKIFSDSTFKY